MFNRQQLKKLSTRLRSGLFAAVFIGTQLAVPLSIFDSMTAAAAAPLYDVCTIDVQGADDQPGQKDLNEFCKSSNDPSGTINISWNWDETSWTGSNTGDACALFDTNNDTKIDYAVCVTVAGKPASQTSDSPRLYSCSNKDIDNCTDATQITVTTGLSCTVSATAPDAFGSTGRSKSEPTTNDTVAKCTIPLTLVGGGTLKDVCSYPSQQPSSDPSDCVITPTQHTAAATIEVKKVLSPSADAGKFNLRIGTTTYATGGDGTDTGAVTVTPATGINVEETAVSGTALSDYSTNVACFNGTTLLPNSGSRTDSTTRSISVNAADGDAIVCTFTNTRLTATVKVVKTVVNDNGGTLQVSDFPLFVDGTSATSGTAVTVNTGAHVVSETNKTGYLAGAWGGDCDSTGHVTVAANQNAVCTITNNDIAPSLTVIKHVVNDDGGTSLAPNFTMNVTGTNVASSSFAGSESGTTTTLNAGSYSVGETGPSGYASSATSTCAGTIALGQSVTCTITNNDIAPLLTLQKVVVDDNGGTAVASDWTLTATQASNQTQVLSGAGSASGSVRANTAYNLAESGGPTGYAASNWSCGSGATVNGASVSLVSGATVTCTITNNDIAPLLTVTKTVVNDDGGTLAISDFPLYVGNVQVTSGVQASFNAGSYLVSEVTTGGYQASSWGGACNSLGNITLAVGGVYACTITNDDIPAQITVTKQVVNNDGGAAKVSDFDLYVGTTKVVSGVTNTFDANQSYTVSEQSVLTGYSQTSLDCTDNQTHASLGATFTPALNQKISCVIVNDDVAPTLTLVKHVTNNDGGTATAANFQGKIDGTNVAWSNPVALAAGDHTATESVLAGGEGYQASDWSGDCATDGSITLQVGENKTCEITNNDIAPKLTVIKHVINDNSGTSKAGDFTMLVNATNASKTSFAGSESGTDVTVNAGTYAVSETAASGYNVSYSADCTGSMTVGQTKTCTVTNNDVPHPHIHVVKSGPTQAHEGDTVTYTFTVTNTGDTTLDGLTVEDTVAGTGTYLSGDTNNNHKLDTNETWLYTADYVIPADQTDNVVNTVKVCANDPDQTNVCDTDTHSLDVLHPAIHVVKSGPSDANEGQIVTYTFVVTNTGDTPLSAVTVADDIAGPASYVSGDANSNGKLDLTESWTFTAQYTIPVPQTGDVHNTGTACGDDALQRNICGTDTHTLTPHDATITVIKDAQPNDPQDFSFTLSRPPLEDGISELLSINSLNTQSSSTFGNNFKLDDDNDPTLSNTKVFTHVVPGAYNLNENQLAGWDLTKLDCGDIRSQQDGSQVGFNVSPGQHVTCTFTNTKRANITIVKDAQPDSSQAFTYKTDASGSGTFTLTDDGTTTASQLFENLVPGTYTFSEDALSGWNLKGITCTQGITVVQDGSKITVTLAAGDDATCTFVNKKQESGEVLGAVTVATPTPQAVLVNTGEPLWESAIIGSTVVLLALTLAGVSQRRRYDS